MNKFMELDQNDRLSARIGNRVVEFEEEAPAILPPTDEMKAMVKGMVPQIDYRYRQITTPAGFFTAEVREWRMYPKAQLFQWLAQHLDSLRQQDWQLMNWLAEVIVANTVLDNSNYDIRSEAVQIIEKIIGGGNHASPLSLTEIAARTEHDIALFMNDYLCLEAVRLVNSFFSGLAKLLENQQVGQIKYTSSGICKGCFFRNIVTDSHEVRHKGTKVTRERDGNQITEITRHLKERITHRVFKQELHYHELMNAVVYPWNDTTVPKPARIVDLLANTPPSLTQFVKIIVGDEILRRVIEWEVNSGTTSEEYVEESRVTFTKQDPFIAIGGFVVAGWEPGEQ